jgi:hypothetical protein
MYNRVHYTKPTRVVSAVASSMGAHVYTTPIGRMHCTKPTNGIDHGELDRCAHMAYSTPTQVVSAVTGSIGVHMCSHCTKSTRGPCIRRSLRAQGHRLLSIYPLRSSFAFCAITPPSYFRALATTT